MALDPTERLRQWTGALFLIGLAVLDVPAIGWEIFIRHGVDPGAISAMFVITSVILVGPLGIRVVKKNGDD